MFPPQEFTWKMEMKPVLFTVKGQVDIKSKK